MRLLSLSALTSLTLAATCWVGDLYAETALSPEAQVQVPIKALRNNDILAVFKLAPADQQAEAKANWQKARTEASPEDKAKITEFFNTMLAPNAVDELMAIAEPQLAQINSQELVGYVQMFGGMAAMQMAQDPKTAEAGKMLQQLVGDVAAWVPKAGFEDPAKLRTALTSVVAATKALGVKTSDELLALDLEQLLTRSGPAIKELKAALRAYDLQTDAVLDSFKLSNVQGSDDKRTATAQVTLFGHSYSVPVNLVLKDGVWQIENEQLEKGLEGLAPGM